MAASPVSTTSHSSTRMRTLVRWSDSSLRNTTPMPRHGEPSRRMLGSVLLEIPRVDHFEARLLDREPEQLPAGGDHGGCRLRAHVAVGEQPYPVGPSLLDRRHPGPLPEPLGQPGGLRLDFGA